VTTIEVNRFATELHRWRNSRRVSQLELAHRAGTTQRHLSFIERGRSVPGRSMVVRLAESLGLSLRERNALLLAAGYAPLFPESRLDDPELRPVRHALHRILEGHEPYPAVICRRHGELVGTNAAVDVLIEDVAPELLVPPVNSLRLALHPQGMAPRIGNFADWAQHIVENLRAEVEHSPDPATSELLAELEGYVPSAAPGHDHLGFAVPLRLRCAEGELQLITTVTSFATAVDVTLAELKLEAFLPADEDTAEILRARARARAERDAASGQTPHADVPAPWGTGTDP
jgi:transcriptional regulator with XRE-family HTH domain